MVRKTPASWDEKNCRRISIAVETVLWKELCATVAR